MVIMGLSKNYMFYIVRKLPIGFEIDQINTALSHLFEKSTHFYPAFLFYPIIGFRKLMIACITNIGLPKWCGLFNMNYSGKGQWTSCSISSRSGRSSSRIRQSTELRHRRCARRRMAHCFG